VTVKAGNLAGTDSTPPQVPPKTLRQQAQRLSPVGGRALQSGRLDADVDDVVGGDVGGPAVTAAVRRQAAPAQRGVPCAAAWLVLYLPVSWLIEAECGYLVGSIAYLQEKEMC
jgi:hypothetical protein